MYPPEENPAEILDKKFEEMWERPDGTYQQINYDK